MGALWFVALVGFLLSELYVLPSFALPPKQQASYQRPQHGFKPSQQNALAEAREQVNSVIVTCHPDSLEILIQADLFGVGASVKNGDLRLGVEKDESCKATASLRDEYKITVGLLDCGTKHWMTEDSLVYTNLLIYSPEASADGVIRMDEAVIPIECHYKRKYSLSSSALTPNWVPFVSTLSAMENLDFDLNVMTPDWLNKRSSNVFYLGEPINIEASVRLGHHIALRVFLSKCVATLTPDEHSLPRYVFIKNGCLLDSQIPNSRSQFLSRQQDDKLYLVIDAFRFHNENRGELYITCHMTAVPVNDAEAPNKACTFVNGRWRSADGNDYLCGYCQSQNEDGQTPDKPSSPVKFGPRGFGRSAKPETFWRRGLNTDQEWDKEVNVGPLLVLPTEKKTEQNNLVLPQEGSRPLHGSSWRSGILEETGSVDEDLDDKVSGLIELKKGFTSDLLTSEDAAENVTSETQEDFPPDVIESDADAAEDDTTEDAENDPDVIEEVDPEVLIEEIVLNNNATTVPSDVSPTTQSNVTLTTWSNTTGSDLSDTKEPKR